MKNVDIKFQNGSSANNKQVLSFMVLWRNNVKKSKIIEIFNRNMKKSLMIKY